MQGFRACHKDNGIRDRKFRLKKRIAQQPGVAIIAVDSNEFYQYKIGVFKGPCSDDPESEPGLHDLLIIGYGTEDNGDEYWLVKNSWAPNGVWEVLEKSYATIQIQKDNVELSSLYYFLC